MLNAAQTLIAPTNRQRHSPTLSPRSYKEDELGVNRKRSLEPPSRPSSGSSPRLAISSILNSENSSSTTTTSRTSSMDCVDDELAKRSRRRISETGQYQSSSCYNISKSSLESSSLLTTLPPLSSLSRTSSPPPPPGSLSHTSPSLQRLSPSCTSARDPIQLPPLNPSSDQQYNRNYNYNNSQSSSHSHSSSISNPSSLSSDEGKADSGESSMETLLKTISSLQSEVHELRRQMKTKKGASPALENAAVCKEQQQQQQRAEKGGAVLDDDSNDENKKKDEKREDEASSTLMQQPRTAGPTTTPLLLPSIKQMERASSHKNGLKSCLIETTSPKSGKSELVPT